MIGITVYECYNPNTYHTDLEGIPYDIEGYRYIIDTGPHVIVGKQMFVRKANCIKAVMNTMKKYNMPSIYEIIYESYPDSELVV